MFTEVKKYSFKIQILLIVIWLPIFFSNAPAQENSSEEISIQAGKRGNPYINFTDGKFLFGKTGDLTAKGADAPAALASADFDGDGTDDLAIVYKTANGGFISTWRGNVESIFPINQDTPPAPFFSETQIFDLSFAPDFLAAGDFNADGRADLLMAKRGMSSLVLLAGNGANDFSEPLTIDLKGAVTAFAVGEMNNFDNLADFAVGITEKGAAKILIFQSPKGAFAAEPQSLKIGKTVSALVFGELDAHPSHDLIAASGDEIVFVSGNAGGKIAAENVLRQTVNFEIADLAIGDFTGDRANEIALLSGGGEVFFGKSNHEITQNKTKKNLSVSSRVFVVSDISESSRLISAKISTRTKADLIINTGNQLNLIINDGADNLSLAATFDASENPVAVLPMRLNKDALNDLVVLSENKLEPTILMTAPTEIITVNNANGTGSGGGTTLFNAIQSANNTPGLQEIQFNLTSGTQISMTVALPYITEAITINGLSQTNGNGEPLVSITTQPMTDATTLQIVGGNSVVRGLVLNCADAEGNPVRLFTVGNNYVESNFIGTNTSGTHAGTTANSAIRIGNSSANTIGGAVVQARNIIAAVGSHGVQINGASSNNLIKGNFIGTNKTGLAALGNGGSGVLIETAASGNVIGGATGGERNIISGNGLSFSDPGSGIKISLPSNTFSNVVIENNFIGTNKNGDAALGNVNGGVRFEYNASVAPTAIAQVFDNVISGNTGDGVYAVNNDVPGEFNAAPQGFSSDILILGRRNTNLNASPEVATPGNRIGTNAAGTAALPNTGNGVRLVKFPSRIEGNTISANLISGIRITDDAPVGNFIADNFIGTNAAGTAALGNGNKGIWIESAALPTSDEQTTKIYDNVISGNTGDGVFGFEPQPISANVAPEGGISDGLILGRRPATLGVSPEVVSPGNRIGTNAAGTSALPNTGNGVNLQNISALVEGNLISANGASGIRAKPPIAIYLPFKIAENYIGTDAGGNIDLGNASDGITLEYSGTVHADAYTSDILSNVVSGNNGDGVRIFGNVTFSNNIANPSGSNNNSMPRTSSFFANIGRQTQNPSNRSKSGRSNTMPRSVAFFVNIGRQTTNFREQATPGNLPMGNRIGTNADGTALLGNAGHGVSITNIPTKVGGDTFADGNIIAHNGVNGIVIFSGTGNLIQSNAIYLNALLNIDLGGDGLTANDAGDADTGANNLQNYPVLTSASSNGSQTIVSGAINTTPNTALKIEFYATSGGAMTVGGSSFGTLLVTSNAMGNASFSATFPVGVTAGRFVSATATTADTNVNNENNTSELSPGVLVLAPTAASVTVTGRVLSPQGTGVSKAIVTLTAPNGETRRALTSSLGYYRFEEVTVGDAYIFNISSKRYTFAPRVVTVNEEITLDFTAES